MKILDCFLLMIHYMIHLSNPKREREGGREGGRGGGGEGGRGGGGRGGGGEGGREVER